MNERGEVMVLSNGFEDGRSWHPSPVLMRNDDGEDLLVKLDELVILVATHHGH
jgi:hypothetical protein